jgi:hypothetical protein
MTDEPVRTRVRTDDGWLDFQDYFVRLHQAPEVLRSASTGRRRRPRPRFARAIALGRGDRRGAVEPGRLDRPDPGRARAAGRDRRRRQTRRAGVGVSGIVGGKALRGPADRMMASLGEESSALGVARRYAAAGLSTSSSSTGRRRRWPARSAALGLEVAVTDTIMTDAGSRAGWRVRCWRRGGHGAAGAGRRNAEASADIVALVPVRSLSGAKSRLGEPLDAEERADLVLALLRRTGGGGARRHLGWRRRRGFDWTPSCCAGPGHGRGFAPAGDRRAQRGPRRGRLAAGADATALIVLPADLPGGQRRPRSTRLAEAAAGGLAQRPESPVVALVPDRHGTGTNALLVAPPECHPVPLRRGQPGRHAAAAAKRPGRRTWSWTGRSPSTWTRPTTCSRPTARLDHEAGR